MTQEIENSKLILQEKETDSLRSNLPKSVSAIWCQVSVLKERLYIHKDVYCNSVVSTDSRQKFVFKKAVN